MNARKSSIDCFNQIKSEGLLTECRFKIYEAIHNLAPCTASEVFAKYKFKTNQSGRFTELRDLGVIYERGFKKCQVTGRNVIVWDLTGRLPQKTIQANSTKKDKINKALNALRELYKTRKNSSDSDWVKVSELIKAI